MSIVEDPLDVYDYEEQYYYQDFETSQETLLDIWNNCVVLSTKSIVSVVGNILVLNFCFGCLLSIGLLSQKWLHLISAGFGLYLLSTMESPSGKLILAGCFISSYLLVVVSHPAKKHLNISSCKVVKLITIALLILCEYYLIGPEPWLEIRGVVMVLVMKLISLIDDIEKGAPVPGAVEYFGYSLCGANVMFGPWISFSEYASQCSKPSKKSIGWITAIFQVYLTSLFFMSISNCWADYFITDDFNRWFIAYREAFSFRTSHYFICYLSELGMVAAGFTNKSWRYAVTDPFEIEFPSCLAMVVKKWNLPMHEFLKKYVYRSWLVYGKFQAILATFLISSFLHGLELKISVVLLSLGLFSYLQVAIRDKLADTFSCCIKVRPCKNCNHQYKRGSTVVRIATLSCSIITVFHLMYLGVLMDPSTAKVGIYKKWQHLFFISHIVMFINLLVIF